MNRDPLHQKITEALNGAVDDQVFERCAQDLLREEYPNLAPVVGGGDAGFDGALSTPQGPYPLICTIRDDVIGNVRANLGTFIEEYGGPKLAVVATTRCLTPRRRRNIEKMARDEFEAVIVGIHDGHDFANRLYRDSPWRNELLGITGNPSALSRFPVRGRTFDSVILIGRDEETEWLRSTDADLLLMGTPGSGKTYLHQQLAEEGLCLFAVDADRGALANAIRDQNPSIIVVDDAHLRESEVEQLVHLRQELGARYRIHANCWPGYADRIKAVLGIPDEQVRSLRLLSRDNVLQLLKELGVHGPDSLLHVLLNHAEGKPGLAFAMVRACRFQDIDRVWTGEALADELLGRGLIRNEEEKCVLAAFAMGGDAGMNLKVVANGLGLTQLKVRTVISELGHGGIIEAARDNGYQVRPPGLRPILVRDAFYQEPGALDATGLLNCVPSGSETAHVLMAARQRGGDVPTEMFEAFVAASTRHQVWQHFAYVSRECAQRVLDHYPDHIPDAASGLLNHLPKKTIKALLDIDIQGTGPEAGAVSNVRRQIHEWTIEDAESVVACKAQLLAAVKEWGEDHEHKQSETFGWALAEVLSVGIDDMRVAPGSGRTVNIRQGTLSIDQINEVAGLWPQLRELASGLASSALKQIAEAIGNWCIPEYNTPRVTEEASNSLEPQGRVMLVDLLQVNPDSRAVKTWASNLAQTAKFDIDIPVDVVFHTLFKQRDFDDDSKAYQERRTQELNALASNVVALGNEAGPLLLTEIEQEATTWGNFSDGWDRRVLYFALAEQAQEPSAWLDSLIAGQIEAELVRPFVCKVVAGDRAAGVHALTAMLDTDGYVQTACDLSLQLDPIDQQLLQAALDRLKVPTRHGAYRFMHLELSPEVSMKLIQHPSREVRINAAFCEWVREPEGEIRDEMKEAWRQAMLEVSHEDSYHTEEVFKKHPDIAYDWLKRKLEDPDCKLYRLEDEIAVASGLLNQGQRLSLLRLFNRSNYYGKAFHLLLGADTSLYGSWLEGVKDEFLKLCPLDTKPGERWAELAIMALDHGSDAEDVSKYCGMYMGGGFGRRSQRYEGLLAELEKIAEHDDPRLRPIGREAVELFRNAIEREKEEEHWEDVRGI